MYYTQQDGRRYHYISDPKFEKLFAKAEEWEYARKHPDWALMSSRDARPIGWFTSEDAVSYGSGDWEMTATLYQWNERSQVLEVRETLYGEDGKVHVERRWYAIGKEGEDE